MFEYKLITKKNRAAENAFPRRDFFNLALRTLIIRVYFINSALRTNIRVFLNSTLPALNIRGGLFKFGLLSLKYSRKTF